jgi:hypothetical protein
MGKGLAKYHVKGSFQLSREAHTLTAIDRSIRQGLPPVSSFSRVDGDSGVYVARFEGALGGKDNVVVKTMELFLPTARERGVRIYGAMHIKECFPEEYRFALFQKGKGKRNKKAPFLVENFIGPSIRQIAGKLETEAEVLELAEEYASTQAKGMRRGILWAHSSKNFALSETGKIIPCDEGAIMPIDLGVIKKALPYLKGNIKKMNEEEVKRFILKRKSAKKNTLHKTLRFFRELPPGFLKKACLVYLGSLEKELS